MILYRAVDLWMTGHFAVEKQRAGHGQPHGQSLPACPHACPRPARTFTTASVTRPVIHKTPQPLLLRRIIYIHWYYLQVLMKNVQLGGYSLAALAVCRWSGLSARVRSVILLQPEQTCKAGSLIVWSLVRVMDDHYFWTTNIQVTGDRSWITKQIMELRGLENLN